MRTIFFGTPEFAVPVLRAMVDGGYPPLRVIARPARRVGRGHKFQDPPVAAWAKDHGLEVLQPEKVARKSFRLEMAAVAPDVAVVVAFGQIFGRRLLALPRHGCLNLHASLLPSYRGAAPIHAAIAAGETVTGVSSMIMEEGLDTGPILLQDDLRIGPAETTPELAARLSELGAGLMVETLRRLERGELTPREQPSTGASYAPQLTKADGVIDWRLTATEISNRLRAYTPWPGQSSMLAGKRVKLISASPLGETRASDPPGSLLELRSAGEELKSVLPVVCGDGTLLALHQVQLPGKRPVTVTDFANGQRLQPGDRFTDETML